VSALAGLGLYAVLGPALAAWLERRAGFPWRAAHTLLCVAGWPALVAVIAVRAAAGNLHQDLRG
jgi:hypothetical protein